MQLADSIVHVRVGGRSAELTLAALKVPSNATDTQFKAAVARHLDLPAEHLAGSAV